MAETKIGRIVLGVAQTNCYFLYPEGSKDCIVIDPADQGGNIHKALERNGFQVKAILLTHGHFDHIWGTKELRELSGAKLYALDEEKELLGDARKNVSAQTGRPYTVEADVYVKDGEELTLAGLHFRVIATPGHTQGSCCYYFPESVGRTDLPTGSGSMLVRSVREKLFPLPEDTKVYPGHGDSTTIGFEKKYNPFCQ